MSLAKNVFVLGVVGVVLFGVLLLIEDFSTTVIIELSLSSSLLVA